MTRKDYVLLTDALLTVKELAEDNTERFAIKLTASVIAQQLEKGNKAFNYMRFMADAGYPDG